MKASEIRELSLEEKQRKLDDLKEELFNLNFQQETGQLENPQKMKQTRRGIARIKTIIKEDKINKTYKEE
ncbi:MAG: 50S ribosomal protein L29 [Proteobacteria bacterium]|nr:50S ribosomal protein L29 [Pseudomonadota bacterium]MBU4414250.1 50S ribosomal protein L29 [Pseudomonadota bacterium]